MNCFRQGCIIFVLLLLTVPVFSEVTPKTTIDEKEIPAYRIETSTPVIDGNLNDPVWTRDGIQFARDFTQRAEEEGMPATESTLVAIAYDDEAIYFAVWLFDKEPDKIVERLVRRDRYSPADYFDVRLDPYHDHQSGFGFSVNASGVLRDYNIFNDNNIDYSWDGIWDAAAKIQPWGWSIEYKIPYHCLRFTEKDVHVWGMNFARWIERKSESNRWNYSPTSESGFARYFGHLTDLKDIKPQRRFELMPYSVAQYNTGPKTLGNTNGKETLGNMGLDMKYGLTSNLNLDVTVNPDFGQVELDSPVLNLSSFETYYSEKRPFFLEGSDLFSTSFRLFYTRRIGRNPSKGIDNDDFDEYLNRPSATTILAAAKINGKLGSGTSISVLNAVTDEEEADYITTEGDQLTQVVEPRSNYSVVRVKQDILGNSFIGSMLTVATQDSYHPAVTGGVDWRLKTSNSVWLLDGQAVFSRNDDVNTGYGYDLTFEKASGKHLRGAIGAQVVNPDLDLNRMGFLSSNNSKEAWYWMQYRTVDTWWIIRSSWNNINMYGGWNFDNVNLYKGGNVNSHFEFINNWTLGGGISVNAEALDQYETRDNGLWLEPSSWSWWANLTTDARKKVSFTLNPGSGESRHGSWWANYIGMTYTPKSNMEYEFGVNYLKTNNATRWVENDDSDRAIFADLDKDEIQLSMSMSVIPHRNLSVQLSGEGVLAALDYENYREYLGEHNYGTPLDGFNHDYIWTALNTTLLLRWEYNSGSTIYLVWTRSRYETDDQFNYLKFNRDLDRYISEGSKNIFLIKASYWMNI